MQTTRRRKVREGGDGDGDGGGETVRRTTGKLPTTYKTDVDDEKPNGTCRRPMTLSHNYHRHRKMLLFCEVKEKK
ncbi:hypothetical protein M0804_002752 [Polistes exclamans]|nr:hypothetical protein M0804_002752 [Polistes exclamans]